MMTQMKSVLTKTFLVQVQRWCDVGDAGRSKATMEAGSKIEDKYCGVKEGADILGQVHMMY